MPIFCSVFLILIISLEGKKVPVWFDRDSLTFSFLVASVVQFIRGRHSIKRDFPLATSKRPSLSPWARVRALLTPQV